MSEKNQSLYEILGVDKSATDKEIQTAYRKLARQYHPDVNKSPDAVEKFQEIAAAYAILGDAEKRAKYDQGMIDDNGDERYTEPNHDFFFQNFMQDMGFMHDFSFTRRHQNTDVIIELNVDANQLFNPSETNVVYTRRKFCEECSSKGMGGLCSQCRGSGRHLVIQQAENMIYQQDMGPCTACQGKGTMFDENCQTCNGLGILSISENITVQIPANCAHARLSINGMGNCENPSSPPGNLYIVIVPKSKNCTLRGYVAYYELLVDPIRAMLGAKMKAPGLKSGETLIINVPKLSKQGSLIVLKEKGLCDPSGKRHDAHFRVVYKMPDELSKEQEDILKQYLETNDNTEGKQS